MPINIRTTKKAYPLRARELATDLLDANPADVIVHVDGDDWLPSPEVLQRLNKFYRTGKIHATYGNAVSYRVQNGVVNFSTYNMSTRWNAAQNQPDGAIHPFRKIEKDELVNGWANASWCGMHLRTYLYAKWLCLDRNTFKKSDGNYLRIATDAAIILPIFDYCAYETIQFLPNITYVYQNSSNTIHAKGEVKEQEKKESLKVVYEDERRLNKTNIIRTLKRKNYVQFNNDYTVLYDNLYISNSKDKYSENIKTKSELNESAIVTVITPDYLADALLSLVSYKINLSLKCKIYIFISTNDEKKIKACKKIFDDSDIVLLFPEALKHTKEHSASLAKKYKLNTDEYRWGMKSVVLLELLYNDHNLALFLDPDTYTVSDITDVHQKFFEHPISVFPHFRDPEHESHRSILYKDGFFNGGVLAATPTGIPHLIRLYERCLNELKKDPARHRWDDQKYFDLFTLEVENLNVNLDRGINYNSWNHEPVEGMVAPSQKSIILKTGYFVRHWHVSTTLIKNTLELKGKQFRVYRPLVAIYLLTLFHTILLIKIKFHDCSYNSTIIDLEGRIEIILERLSLLIDENIFKELVSYFQGVLNSESNGLVLFAKSMNENFYSICYDNSQYFSELCNKLKFETKVDFAANLNVLERICLKSNLDSSNILVADEKITPSKILEQNINALQHINC